MNIKFHKMKKIIGILGVAIITATMYFSTNAVSDSFTDTSLASLMSLNKAHADSEGTATVECRDYPHENGTFRFRKCNGCILANMLYGYAGTCTISY